MIINNVLPKESAHIKMAISKAIAIGTKKILKIIPKIFCENKVLAMVFVNVNFLENEKDCLANLYVPKFSTLFTEILTLLTIILS